MPHLQDPSSSPKEDPEVAAERKQKIRIKNRRKMYLDRHPSYFTSPDLELVDPLLYDRCIRTFQSTSERESDGRSKGYSGILEADLWRSEAKLAAIRKKKAVEESEPGPSLGGSESKGKEVVEDEQPKSKEEGLERWKFEMTMRFLRGEDEDFDYGGVDEDEEWDEVERREGEERWFDEEEPEWVADESSGSLHGGETGIQDF